jgi:adenylate cyclase
MTSAFPWSLLEDPAALARCDGWNETVYRDLLALQRGEIAESDFLDRHLWTRAILVLDMTDFTSVSLKAGDVNSLLRILDAQKVILPALQEHHAQRIHCFADDVVALLDSPEIALDAALAIQRRIKQFNASDHASDNPTLCCIGIGYGPLLRIGPNLAQGAEMNRASKLGEDLARGGEILATENVQEALSNREDVRFTRQRVDEHPFPFFKVDYED